MGNRTVALVPLRGGSKSISGKNIRQIAGKPLCAWVLEAACNCPAIDEVVVSTDSAGIRRVVDGLGLGLRIIDRPAELATDTATTESVMLHALGHLNCDILVTIQATSPLTTADDLAAALQEFVAGGFDSMLTGVRWRRFFWEDAGRAINYDPVFRPRRQDFPGCIMENGAFYITRRESLETTRCRLGGRIGVHTMSEDTAVELDEPHDWLILESLLERRRAAMSGILRRPRLAVFDVDGTLTDGAMYYGQSGESLKMFNARDGHGISRLREAGVVVAIWTAETTSFADARARKLGVERCLTGVLDKAGALITLARECGVGLEEIAVVGDDVNDLAALRLAGIPACPADARPEVRAACRYASPFPGGRGAVRDICEMLLSISAEGETTVVAMEQ
jgi:YrbI family 3-deoxy-D-manno-octulosonate 8-phosphate phosphatase